MTTIVAVHVPLLEVAIFVFKGEETALEDLAALDD
jgi:hypothetical protein